DDGGVLLAGASAGRQKKLAVNRRAIGSRIDHLLRDYQGVRGKIGRDRIRRKVLDDTADLDGGSRGMARLGVQKRYRAAGHNGLPLQSVARGQGARRTAGRGNAPDVAAVDIVLVG